MPQAPIQFSVQTYLPLTSREIAAKMLDVSEWADFPGYGPLPGVRSAEFETKTPQIVGSRIRVVNRDGSRHVEEILKWEPEQRIQMRLSEFSAPLSAVAECFVETWEFEQAECGTNVVRSFELFPKSIWAMPALWALAPLLKRAIAKHLELMRNGG